MNQNPYIAGSRLAVENNRFLSTDPNLPQDPAFTGIFQWRRGRDYSALRASPLRGRPDGRYPRFVAATVS
jgi:hypothetical protein